MANLPVTQCRFVPVVRGRPSVTPSGTDAINGGDAETRLSDPAERREYAAKVVRDLRAGGDREAHFRALFDIYYRPLQRFFARKGFEASQASELTQDTFLGIYKGLDGLRDEERFEAWLYRIATTTYLKKVRSKRTAKRSGYEISHDETEVVALPMTVSPHQLDDVLDDERQQAMRDAIRELPDQMRRCLTLRVYHDLSYREIATVMKLKIGTIKAHLSQAKARLRANLKDYSIDLPD